MRNWPVKTHLHPKSKLALAIALVIGVSTNASAQIAFEDVSTPAGFGASGSETWGAAWGDIDGDHYPDIFIGNHRTRAALFRNNRNGTFTDVSQQVDASHIAGWTGGRSDPDKHGAVWGDVDNDGDADLLLSVSSGDDVLLINENGLLTDHSLDYGINLLRHSATRMNLFLDYTGDGRLDLASIGLNYPGYSPQLSNGTFGHGTGVELPISCSSDAQFAHLMDINPAAGLELLCAPRKELYPKSINAFANGVVTNVTSGFPQFGPVNDAITLDYNRDLRPDLFMIRGSERPSDAYQSAPDRFEAQFITAVNKTKSVKFKSSGILTISASLREGSDPEGNPAYIDIGSSGWSPSSLVFQLDKSDPKNTGLLTGSPGINIGYNPATDEWQIVQGNRSYSYSYLQVSSTAPISDLAFIGASGSDIGYKPILANNNESGIVQVTNAGFNTTLRCQSAVAGDFDNDMDEDIFLACTAGSHNISNVLYLNNGNGKFTEVANAGGASGSIGAAIADHAGTSESVVAADYDLDGYLDLLVTNGNNMRPLKLGGPKNLFHNLGGTNGWIEFDLVGTTSNRDGIGSKVYISSGGVSQYREQNGGYHRWSQNFMRMHAGLAGNTSADVTVQWPDGTSTVYSGLPANCVYQLKQDGTRVTLKGGLDSDADGLGDDQEVALGTDPNNPDTDADGLNDGAERARGTNPLNRDTDGEGLTDGDEVNIYGTNPLKANTDGDGLSDRVEVLVKHTDPLKPDTDGDGLTDGQEAGAGGYGTNPLNADTDGGGVSDGVEVGRGTNPLVAADDL